MSTVPEDPYVLEITSVAYGSQDFTAFTRAQFTQYLSQNPDGRSWSFTSGIGFFQTDPNPNVNKATVVVWRNTIPTPDSEVVWSNFKKVCAAEGSPINVTFDGVGDKPYAAPVLSNPAIGRCVIAAYWYTKDCTAAAQNIAATQYPDQYHGLQFNVSVATLGADPDTSKANHQFSVTYGGYIGGGNWTFRVQTAVGPNTGWNLSLPFLFPPCVKPMVVSQQNYMTFRNESSGATLYPQIFRDDQSLAWDGRDTNFAVPNGKWPFLRNCVDLCVDAQMSGTSKDVDLIAWAKLQERGNYFCGWTTLDGLIRYGCGSTLLIATSSPMARPAAVYARFTVDGILCNFDYVQFNKPMSYQPADLRLNIYSVTYGTGVYTDYVRQQYFSNTIFNPPTNTNNSWGFTPTSSPVSPNYFGPDPNPGNHKTCVVIYRVAYCIGQTNGVVTGPNDPQPWDPAYKSQNIQPLHTDQYPILQDITGFLIAAVREGNPLTFTLLNVALTAWTPPKPLPNPFVAAAVWSDKDVTSYVFQSVQSQSANGTKDSTISVSTQAMGKTLSSGPDPWVGVMKQVTVLMGYPSVPGDGTTLQWRTIVNMNAADPWLFVIPANLSSVPVISQLPAAYVSDAATEPQFIAVLFNNKTSFNVWPQVTTSAGQIFWDGKTVDVNKWMIGPSTYNSDLSFSLVVPKENSSSEGLSLLNRSFPADQAKTVLLINDAHGTEGASYSLNFATDKQWTFPPFTGWVTATAKDRWKMNFTYMPNANSLINGQYDILREVVYGGPH